MTTARASLSNCGRPARPIICNTSVIGKSTWFAQQSVLGYFLLVVASKQKCKKTMDGTTYIFWIFLMGEKGVAKELLNYVEVLNIEKVNICQVLRLEGLSMAMLDSGSNNSVSNEPFPGPPSTAQWAASHIFSVAHHSILCLWWSPQMSLERQAIDADGLQQMECGLQQFTILKAGEHAWTYYQVHLTPHWNYKPPTTTINRWNNPISIICAPSPIRQFDQKVTTFEITAPFKNSTFQCWKNAHTMLERYPRTLVHNLKGHSLRWLMFTIILDFHMFFSDVIQAIFFSTFGKGTKCAGKLTPQAKVEVEIKTSDHDRCHRTQYLLRFRKHWISYGNLYGCIRSKSVNCQILAIFQWQWKLYDLRSKINLYYAKGLVSSKCGSTYINLLSNFVWAGSFLIMLHDSSSSINHP